MPPEPAWDIRILWEKVRPDTLRSLVDEGIRDRIREITERLILGADETLPEGPP